MAVTFRRLSFRRQRGAMDETEGVRKGSAAPSSTDQDKRRSHNLIRHILAEIMSRDQGHDRLVALQQKSAKI